MKQIFYLPNGDAQRGTWFSNFTTKLPTYKTKFGITVGMLASNTADTQCFLYALLMVAAGKTFEHNCATYKTALRNGPADPLVADIPVFTAPADAPTPVAPGIFIRLSALVRVIKNHPAYTEAIGKDLGIVGAEYAAKSTEDEQKPLLKTKIAGGFVQLKYVKGDTDGVKIESKRGTETSFALLDKVTKSSYSDERPNLIALQSEQRAYRCWYMKGDVVIGVVSDIVVIAVPG